MMWVGVSRYNDDFPSSHPRVPQGFAQNFIKNLCDSFARGACHKLLLKICVKCDSFARDAATNFDYKFVR